MKLSIIVPVYNVEQYIRKTLDSIFSQNTDDDYFEVIIVNDGSSDNSMKVVCEFVERHKNIVVINQTNKGLSSARNVGIKAAKGDYVWFVDSDDWIENKSINYILELVNERIADVFVFGISEYDEESGDLVKNRILMDGAISVETDLLGCLKNNIEITPMQIYVIRLDFIKENNLMFVENILHEDMEFAPRMLVNANKIVIDSHCIYCYLKRSSGSITSSAAMFNKRIVSLIKIAKEQKHFYNNIIGKRNRKAFYNVRMWLVVNTFNRINMSNYDIKNDDLRVLAFFASMREVVLRNLFYKADFNVLVCRCIYLISPKLLLRIGKGI